MATKMVPILSHAFRCNCVQLRLSQVTSYYGWLDPVLSSLDAAATTRVGSVMLVSKTGYIENAMKDCSSGCEHLAVIDKDRQLMFYRF